MSAAMIALQRAQIAHLHQQLRASQRTNSELRRQLDVARKARVRGNGYSEAYRQKQRAELWRHRALRKKAA